MAISGRSFPSHHVFIRNAQAPAAQGQAQALVGTIACNLAFDYASGAVPNDSSPLTVAHTLQGTVAEQLIYTYTSGGQLIDQSSLNVAHTLQGSVDDSLGAAAGV